MKTLLAGTIAILLSMGNLQAQDAARPNSEPLPYNAYIQHLNEGTEVKAVVVYDRDPSLNEYALNNQFFFEDEDGQANAIAFRAYPNPVVDNLWLEMAGPEMDFYVTLYNQLGQPVGVVNRNIRAYGNWESNIDFSGLTPGTYFLVFTDENGHRLAAQQVVKQY